MANKPEPGMPILIPVRGRDYELRFPLGVLKELERDHGISVLRGIKDANTAERLAVLLFYGLKTQQPDITLEWVEQNVDASALLSIAQLLTYAATGAWPDLPAGIAPNGASPTTGSPSGPTVDMTLASVSASSGA